MTDSQDSRTLVDGEQHAPPLSDASTSSTSVVKRVSFVLEHMDPKLQETFDPLIQKMMVPCLC